MRRYPRLYDRRARRMEYVHRIVAAAKLGRVLRPGEVVHHVNGDKWDFHPENLVVVDVAVHSRVEHLLRQLKRGQPLLFIEAIPENLKACFPNQLLS